MPSSAIAAASSANLIDAPKTGRYPLVAVLLGLGAFWFICCRHLSAEWSYNEQYSYGWFVPFFALYLFWLRWEDRPQPESRNSKVESRKGRGFMAALLSIPLLLAIFPLRLIEVANPDWRLLSWAHALVAVGLTLLLVWWVGGKPWLRHFAFPVLFFLVAVPWLTAIEQPIIQGLMPTVASIATETLSLFGIPAEVRGNLIRINGGLVGVNEACSGVRSLQTSLMIGLLFGELKRLGLGSRILLVVAAIGIAFVANCGRAFFLVWIAGTRGVSDVEHWHDIAGYTIVGLVFLGCLGLTKFLAGAKSVERTEVGEQRSEVRGQLSHAEGSAPSSFVISHSSFAPAFAFPLSTLIWFLMVEGGVELWYRAHETNLQRSAQWNVRWPESALQFHEAKIDEQTKSILHYDEGRGAMWMLANEGLSLTNWMGANQSALLYFFRWYPGHNSALLANAHRPDICLPASGWRQIGDYNVRPYVVTPSLTIPFRHFEFSNDNTGRTKFAHAFYCVWEDRVPKGNNGTASSGMAAAPSDWSRGERLQAVLDGRRHLGQQVMEYLLIDSRPISPEQAEEAFAATVRELIAPVGTTVASASHP